MTIQLTDREVKLLLDCLHDRVSKIKNDPPINYLQAVARHKAILRKYEALKSRIAGI